MSGPQSIVFTRHAEKPGEHGAPHGVNQHGETDSHSLSVRGWTRAGALAALIGHAPVAGWPGVDRPTRVFATKPSEKTKSRREVDTAMPTAQRVGVEIDESFAHGDESKLAKALLESSEPAFVVWHHGNLPELLGHLPISNREAIPNAWPEDRFDLLWVLTKSGDAYAFSEVAQDLLDGDAA